MTYLVQAEIAANRSMLDRVAQACAEEGHEDPDAWTYDNRREWAAAPDWDDAWAYAQATHPEPDPDPANPVAPYDPGADDTVICLKCRRCRPRRRSRHG
jgi:hypothetical protein